MGVSGTVAAVAALASAASATNSIVSGAKTEHAQKIDAQQQTEALAAQTAKADQLQKDTDAQSSATAAAAAQASQLQRQRAAAAGGRSDTILTGGTSGPGAGTAPTSKKTLLGM
jgi:membrane protein involved in colicin uptake